MKFKFFDEINSTNTYLRRQLRIEEFEVIVAKKQTDGKGKRDSTWISSEGAALFSFGVNDNYELDEKITIFTGYIVYKVLKNYIENKDKLTFKWPNDILLSGRKLGGILVEIINHKNGLLNLVIGIGINVKLPQSAEISQPYAQLTELDLNIDREKILIKVIQRIYSRLAQFEEKGIDEEFMQQWINHNEFFGDEVNIFTEQGAISGIEKGIDKRGYLKVITDEGERYFNAGEVSLRRK